MSRRLALSVLLLAVLYLGPPQAPTASRAGGKLRDATAGQAERFADAFGEVEKWIADKAFPGAVLAVGQHGSLMVLKAFGWPDYSPGTKPERTNEIFDMASVSKVVATTTAAAILYERGRIALEAPVIGYVPEFAGTPMHEDITVRHLLSHSSGLHVQARLWGEARNRAELLQRVHQLQLASKPGEKAQYRDYNMILMGEIVERVTGQPLDRFLRRGVFGPLRMKDTGYNPSKRKLPRIAPTEFDKALRNRLVRGQVHDENCYVMGGVCGHAGLFSTARDLAVFAQMMLNEGIYGGKRILKEETVRLFTARQPSPEGTTRALGWDTPAPGSWAGERASVRAVMHTGFTGTSIYIDPERDAFVVLLTNRVYPTRDNGKISQARPAIHTAVLAALDRK